MTWLPISIWRTRLGRPSLVTSPRIALTSSSRVECSAGTRPNMTVDTNAPPKRNAHTRQSPGGTVSSAESVGSTNSGGRMLNVM